MDETAGFKHSNTIAPRIALRVSPFGLRTIE
jgi:hypothetical protein